MENISAQMQEPGALKRAAKLHGHDHSLCSSGAGRNLAKTTLYSEVSIVKRWCVIVKVAQWLNLYFRRFHTFSCFNAHKILNICTCNSFYYLYSNIYIIYIVLAGCLLYLFCFVPNCPTSKWFGTCDSFKLFFF